MAELAEVVLELYGLVPTQFTAARAARAKEARGAKDTAGAQAIGALPKPSAAAAVVNLLVRQRGTELERLFQLGTELRAAQEDLDRTQMQRLGRTRQESVATVARAGRAVAEERGMKVSASALGEVEQTLQAALADPHAEAAVRTGYLTRALASTGLEPVDLSDAVAIPLTEGQTSATAPTRNPQRAAAARQALEEASRRSDEAEARLAELEHRIDALAPRRTQLEDEVADLEQKAVEARSRIAALEREADRLERDRADAAEHLDTARSRERLARQRPGAED